jgi:hypothetical protein
MLHAPHNVKGSALFVLFTFFVNLNIQSITSERIANLGRCLGRLMDVNDDHILFTDAISVCLYL